MQPEVKDSRALKNKMVLVPNSTHCTSWTNALTYIVKASWMYVLGVILCPIGAIGADCARVGLKIEIG